MPSTLATASHASSHVEAGIHNTAGQGSCGLQLQHGGDRADVESADAERKGMTLDGFRRWSKNRAPSFVRTVRAMVCDGQGSAACPQLQGGSAAALLQPRWAWALSGALVPKQTVSFRSDCRVSITAVMIR